jgi:hypothetical protein
MSTDTYYTTLGPVRGTCGHRHKEPRTALDCLDRDRSGCRSQGGYSDRRIVRVPDGTAPGGLDDDRIARAPSDVTMGHEVLDDRPQWVDEYEVAR